MDDLGALSQAAKLADVVVALIEAGRPREAAEYAVQLRELALAAFERNKSMQQPTIDELCRQHGIRL